MSSASAFYNSYMLNRKFDSRPLYWTVVLSFAAVLLYLSLRGIRWSEVWRTVSHANIRLLILAFGVSSIALMLRALRWRVLLKSRADVGIATAFWALCTGYFGNNFLPARAGEIIRSFLISARTGLSKTFVLTTALAERLADAVSLVIISSIVLLTLRTRPGWFNVAAKPFAIVGLCGAACIAVLPPMERIWEKLLRALPIPHTLSSRMVALLEQILVGLRSFHDMGRLARFTMLTGIIWFIDATAALVSMRALGFKMPLGLAFLLITGLGLGSALPATPGYVGIYQFVTVSVLTPFGFAKSDAIAYSFLSQAMQYVFFGFYGLLALSRQRGISLRTITQQGAA